MGDILNNLPAFPIIQGGMGVGVSGWRLARAVSTEGQLGVISGTAMATMLARQLERGDPEGHLRRALDAFPLPKVAEGILDRFFVDGGKPEDQPFSSIPLPNPPISPLIRDLTVVSAFVFTFLARQGHDQPVGINLLEKIQVPTLLVLFGAMLAGIDVVLVGAGIPRQIPDILDRLASGRVAEMRLDVSGAPETVRFDPAEYFRPHPLPSLKRPQFLAIVSSPTLARHLIQKTGNRVDGLVVESPVAGGHNAPPRGNSSLSPSGEPVYGPRDAIDPAAFRDLGLPFWLAGGFGKPGKLAEARAAGATGIQVGTAFAFCEESGIDPELKRRTLQRVSDGTARVFTDPEASPTGFPFKVVDLPGSLSDPEVYARRERVCDVGFLREGYRDEAGNLRWRCPAEPEETYRKKGGPQTDISRRQCLCNSLLATAGLGQIRASGLHEPPLLTAGDDLSRLGLFLENRPSYSAADVIRRLLSDV